MRNYGGYPNSRWTYRRYKLYKRNAYNMIYFLRSPQENEVPRFQIRNVSSSCSHVEKTWVLYFYTYQIVGSGMHMTSSTLLFTVNLSQKKRSFDLDSGPAWQSWVLHTLTSCKGPSPEENPEKTHAMRRCVTLVVDPWESRIGTCMYIYTFFYRNVMIHIKTYICFVHAHKYTYMYAYTVPIWWYNVNVVLQHIAYSWQNTIHALLTMCLIDCKHTSANGYQLLPSCLLHIA